MEKMTATASAKDKVLDKLPTGSSQEMQNVATSLTNIVAETLDDSAVCDKRQVVCTSCQHLYKNNEVVLTPAALCHTHHEVGGRPTSKEADTSYQMSKPNTWKARRYNGLCNCAEVGLICNCNSGNQHPVKQFLQISAGTLWGPRIKKILLVIAALIPFIFLIAYLVFTYK